MRWWVNGSETISVKDEKDYRVIGLVRVETGRRNHHEKVNTFREFAQNYLRNHTRYIYYNGCVLA